ncbi:MAG: redoxin domain-containing protein [Polyangiaceae bacterium]|nr:redoxin domain-containing protein [Polyangiaceae bacterium]
MRGSFSLLLWLVFSLTGCGGPSAPARDPQLEAVSLAPAFSAPDESGTLRSLREFRGRAVVLYFYPKDGTPGCTKQACAFRDAWDRLQATGAIVLGVSLDSVESHAAFKAEHRLPFPLLSDLDGRILEAYGVPRSPQGYAARTTFIIDARGVIRRIFPEVDPALHIDEVLPVLQQLAREQLDADPSAKPAADGRGRPPPATPPSGVSASRTWLILLEPARETMPTEPTADEEAAVKRHFDYLRMLRDSGVLVLAGPSLDPPYTGLVIFRAADRDAAERVLSSDPAVGAGVFKARLTELRISLRAAR